MKKGIRNRIAFLKRAFLTFIQFVILGNLPRKAGDYVFRNGAFCQCTLRVIDPKSLFKDLKAAEGSFCHRARAILSSAEHEFERFYGRLLLKELNGARS